MTLTPEIQTQIIKILGDANINAQQIYNFVITNLPLLAQQVLTYHFWFAMLGIVSGIVMLVAAGYFIYKAIKHLQDENDDGWEMPVIAVSVLVAVIGLIFLCVNACDMTKVVLAPDAVVCEYVKELVR